MICRTLPAMNIHETIKSFVVAIVHLGFQQDFTAVPGKLRQVFKDTMVTQVTPAYVIANEN